MPTIDQVEATLVSAAEHGLPALDYRPMSLKPAFLWVVLVWNLTITGLLVAVVIKPDFHLVGIWSYFVIQIMPTIIGTITSVLLDSIVMNLFRIAPYIACAESSGGSKASKTILRTFFPSPGFRTAVRNGEDLSHGNVLLSVSFIFWFFSYTILGFKGVLLNTVDYHELFSTQWEVFSTEWAVLTLLVFYSLVNAHTLWVIWYLRGRATGLLWDPVSIADQLALFRRAHILSRLKGSSITTRDSMRNCLEDEELRLGYWKCGDTYWHGFGPKTAYDGEVVDNNAPEGQGNVQRIPSGAYTPTGQETKQLTTNKLREIRYSSGDLFMSHGILYFFAILALILSTGFIIALAMSEARSEDRYLQVDISYNVSRFLFQWLPITATGLFTWFWEDLSMFYAQTEPFKALSSSTGVAADDSLLLNYTCLPRPVAIFVALGKGHARVAVLMVIAILGRLLPIVVGSAISVFKVDDWALLRFSRPLSIIIIVWLVLYLVLVIWISAEDEPERQLPRFYRSIADLLSWTCSSSLIRDDNFAGEGNPFDITLKGRERGQDNQTSEVTQRVSGQGQQWYMKARLRMARKRYRFGVVPVYGESNMYTMGIEAVSPDNTYINLGEPKPSLVARFFCWGKRRGKSQQQTSSQMTYRMLVSTQLVMIGEKDKRKVAA
ncbi:hypothetical protein PG985_009346 [Apiospora marii]|uniref:uncharacterized protein n=1 Tax=Apiospora marii TaxID=335849 RepID=UPI003131122F